MESSSLFRIYFGVSRSACAFVLLGASIAAYSQVPDSPCSSTPKPVSGQPHTQVSYTESPLAFQPHSDGAGARTAFIANDCAMDSDRIVAATGPGVSLDHSGYPCRSKGDEVRVLVNVRKRIGVRSTPLPAYDLPWMYIGLF